MKRRNINSLLVDLLTVVLYIAKHKIINDECIGEYCVVFCANRQLIISQ
jgi:hypothetical protein